MYTPVHFFTAHRCVVHFTLVVAVYVCEPIGLRYIFDVCFAVLMHRIGGFRCSLEIKLSWLESTRSAIQSKMS